MRTGVRTKPLCEKCEQGGVVRRIVYGFPSPSAITDPKRDYVFGGCCVDSNSPQWMCETCGRTFHYKHGWREAVLEADE